MDNSYYAGAFSIMAGTCDLKIDFKSSEPICDKDGKPVGIQQDLLARITLSLPAAKDLASGLQEALSGYEKQFGKMKSGKELNDLLQTK